MRVSTIQLAWLVALISGIGLVSAVPSWPTPLNAHSVYLAFLIVTTSWSIRACRQRQEHGLGGHFCFVLVGLMASFIYSMF
jgi:hypothetical protein